MPRSGVLFALKTQILKDRSEERSSRFFFLISRRPVLRLVYQVFSSAPAPARGALCLLYASALSACRADFGDDSPVAVEKYANERKQIDFLWPVLAARGFVRWEWKPAIAASLFYFGHRAAANPASVPKIFRIARRICERYPLFVAMRAIEAALGYAYCREMLRRKRVKLIVSSSDGNPYGRALMAAARAEGVPLAFISHGSVAETPVKAVASLAILHGRAAAEDFALQRSEIGEVLLLGYRREGGIRRLGQVSRVLVCLGAAPDLGFLPVLGRQIRSRFPGAALVVRPHPHAITGVRKLAAMARQDGWALSSLPKVSDELATTDLLLAANSTVHLDGLAAGVPSLFVPSLDAARTQPLPFIREMLIAGWDDFKTVGDINAYYARPDFRAGLGHYMSQDKTSEEFFEEFGRCIDGLLRPGGKTILPR